MRFYLATILLVTSFSAHAALHKWVDADGVVHYSDSVPDSVTKSQTLRSVAAPPPAAAASGTAAPKSFAEQQADQRRAEQAKKEADDKAAKDKELADAQKQNCQAARENLATLQNAPRLATYNEQGERIIMDDDARQQRIDEAQKAISKYCK